MEARHLFTAVKSVLSAGWLTLPFKALSVFAAGAGAVLSGVAIGTAAPKEMEPPAGVQITSSDPIFLASGAGQNFYAAGGLSFVGGVPVGKGKVPIPAGFTVSVPLGVALMGGTTADLFGAATASVHAGLIADIAAIKETGVFARLGEAIVVGVAVVARLPSQEVASSR